MVDHTKHSVFIKTVAAVLTVGVAVFFVSFGWIGFSESDDVFYAAAAQGWQGSFFLSQSHWGLRHAIVLPMALIFGLFGQNELTLVAPILLYLALILALVFYCAYRLAGFFAGLVAALLVVSIPVVSAGASIVYTDLPETFFALTSAALFIVALGKKQSKYFILSGAAAGLGMITRETSVVLAAFYGLLFLFNFGGRRSNYLWIGFGAALVLALDTAYLAGSSGDLFYRLHVSQKGVSGDNPALAAQFITHQGLDRFGTLEAPRWLQAWIVLFFSQHFGIFTWLALPAGIWLALKGAEQSRVEIRLFMLLALSWFVMLSYVFTFLWLVPRYQILTACSLAIPLAVWLTGTFASGRQVLAAGLLAADLAVGLLATGVSDRNPLFGEKTMLEVVAKTGATVVTDPATLRGVTWLADAKGLRERVVARIPVAGELYFMNEHPRRGLPGDWPLQKPEQHWTLIEGFVEPARPMGKFVLSTGAGRFLPSAVIRKLNPAPRHAALYHVPGPAENSLKN